MKFQRPSYSDEEINYLIRKKAAETGLLDKDLYCLYAKKNPDVDFSKFKKILNNEIAYTKSMMYFASEFLCIPFKKLVAVDTDDYEIIWRNGGIENE